MQNPSFASLSCGIGAPDLLDALDAYGAASALLVERWLDMDLYHEVGRQMAAIRDRGVADPTLTVLSLQLAIAHAELVSALWENDSVVVSDLAMLGVQQRHAVALAALRVAAARSVGEAGVRG